MTLAFVLTSFKQLVKVVITKKNKPNLQKLRRTTQVLNNMNKESCLVYCNCNTNFAASWGLQNGQMSSKADGTKTTLCRLVPKGRNNVLYQRW